MNETTHLPDSGFGKIFQTTYTGSLMGSGPVVMAVWPYVIANTRPPGVVELVPRYIAAVLGCTADEVSTAISFLQNPDEESRSKIEDGRRIVHLTGHMFQVPTWSIYREKRDDEARKVYFREAKRKSRASKDVKDILGKSNLSTQAEAEAEANKENIFPLLALEESQKPNPLKIRVGKLLGRRPTTKWSAEELRLLKGLGTPDESEMALMEEFYGAEIAKEEDYRRTTIERVLKHWSGETDKARDWKRRQK